jgi:hypothetical protein
VFLCILQKNVWDVFEENKLYTVFKILYYFMQIVKFRLKDADQIFVESNDYIPTLYAVDY